MNYYEDTRIKLATVVRDFHATAYPSLEVNYPDRWITDVEHVSGPFVVMEFSATPQHLDISARRCIRVKGKLLLRYHWRKGTGFKGAGEYTDALFNYLGLQTINSVTYYEVVPFNNFLLPGFQGVSNIVNYQVEYYNT